MVNSLRSQHILQYSWKILTYMLSGLPVARLNPNTDLEEIKDKIGFHILVMLLKNFKI